MVYFNSVEGQYIVGICLHPNPVHIVSEVQYPILVHPLTELSRK